MAKGRPKKETLAVEKNLIDSDAPPSKKARQSKAILLPIPQLPKKSGNVLSCGQNDVGQLGFDPDDVPEKARPALVADIKNIVDVQAGGMHSLLLTKSGEIWSFGCNDEGSLGRDTSEEGSEMKPNKIELPRKAVRISCGDSHSACLLDDGRVFAWGSFRDAHGSMGLTTEGRKQLPIQVLPEIKAVDIASGSDHFVVLAQNGNVYTIGCGEQGQLGRASMRTLTGESRRGTTTLLTPGIISKKAKKFVADAIWATPYCTFLREDSTGTVYGFGLNNYNQVCVKKGKNEFEHFPVATKIQKVKQIAGGQHHTIVLTNDGKVYSIGRKEYGRLGLGDGLKDDVSELSLIEALNDKNIIAISCGAENNFGRTSDGKVYVWGSGTSSTLGTGDEDDVVTPKVLVSAQVKEKNILAVSGGGQHTLFLVEVPSTDDEEVKPSKKETAKNPKSKKEAEPEAEIQKSKEPEIEPMDIGSDITPTQNSSLEKIDVNGNSEKDDKTDASSNADEKTAPKRGRKRKA